MRQEQHRVRMLKKFGVAFPPTNLIVDFNCITKKKQKHTIDSK